MGYKFLRHHFNFRLVIYCASSSCKDCLCHGVFFFVAFRFNIDIYKLFGSKDVCDFSRGFMTVEDQGQVSYFCF